MRNLRNLMFCALTLVAASHAAEPQVQALEGIRQAVVENLKSIFRQHYRNFDIEVAPLDPRLRLPRCDRPLTVSPLREAVPVGAVSVGVECRGGHPWTIYVKAHVRVFQQVAVLSRPLPKGTVLEPGMVALEPVDISRLRQGYFPDTDRVLGKRLKTSLPEGAVLTPQLLGGVKMVSKGDAVMIRVVEGALDVRMGGHALMDGGQGQRIRVLNDRSQRVVEGIVQGPGEVLVAF